MKTIASLTIILLAFFIAVPLQSCNENAGAKDKVNSATAEPFVLTDEFRNYWYAGKAEVSSYKLYQARYGELHEGTATAIFVTEDFSKSRQVKLDDPGIAGNDPLPVLKMNLTKKFNTGIYPYSMMLSVFSPVDINNYQHALKSTASVQEWCGMTYTQLNQRNNQYEVMWHSYFEKEADSKATFDATWLEDELWNLVRIDPKRLPTGTHKVLPGSWYTRLSHNPLQMKEAKLRLEVRNEKSLYFIEYTSQEHTILITFENEFPHKIIGWEETFPGFDGKPLTTTAILDKTIITDYWKHHDNDDRVMREQLNLQKDF